MRAQLTTSEHANEAMRYLLRTPRRNGMAKLWASSRVLAPATIATIPKWMRQQGGFDQPGAVDAAVVPLMRLAMRVGANRVATRATLDVLAPRTAATFEHWTSERQPRRPETITPSEARRRWNPDAPS